MNLRQWATANNRSEADVVAAAREFGFDSVAWNSKIDEAEDALLREHFAKVDTAASAESAPAVVDAPARPVEPATEDVPPVEAEKPQGEPPRRRDKGSTGLLDCAAKCLADAGKPLDWGKLDYAMRAAGWQPEEGTHPTDQVRDAVRQDCVEGGTRFCVADYTVRLA